MFLDDRGVASFELSSLLGGGQGLLMEGGYLAVPHTQDPCKSAQS